MLSCVCLIKRAFPLHSICQMPFTHFMLRHLSNFFSSANFLTYLAMNMNQSMRICTMLELVLPCQWNWVYRFWHLSQNQCDGIQFNGNNRFVEQRMRVCMRVQKKEKRNNWKWRARLLDECDKSIMVLFQCVSERVKCVFVVHSLGNFSLYVMFL